MGRGMARNLHRAGLLHGVWNRARERAATLAAELGCGAAATPAELAAQCDVVVLCVSADADVLEVVDAMAPALRPARSSSIARPSRQPRPAKPRAASPHARWNFSTRRSAAASRGARRHAGDHGRRLRRGIAACPTVLAPWAAR